jgi:hypothetical protein
LFSLNCALGSSFHNFLLFEEAWAANRFIHVISSNQLNFHTLHDSLCEGGFVRAVNADCVELGDFFGKRDEVDDIPEGLALKGSIQSSHNHYFVHVSKLLTEINDVGEELSLIDSDNIIVLSMGHPFHKGRSF